MNIQVCPYLIVYFPPQISHLVQLENINVHAFVFETIYNFLEFGVVQFEQDFLVYQFHLFIFDRIWFNHVKAFEFVSTCYRVRYSRLSLLVLLIVRLVEQMLTQRVKNIVAIIKRELVVDRNFKTAYEFIHASLQIPL